MLKRLKLRLPFYKKETIKIAFEFGLVLSETAKSEKIPLTGEISSRAEEILIKELKTKGTKATAINFIPLILASLGVNNK